MRKSISISILILVLAQFVFAQKATLEGKIVWKNSGKPATESEIILKYTPYKTKTDIEGNYRIKNLKPGNYTVVAFTLGIKTTEQEVNLKAGKNNLDFGLDSIAIELNEFVVQEDANTGFGLMHMNSIDGMDIYSAKKSEVIVMDQMNANLATNNSRQIYSRIAGLNIWESSEGGLQLNIGGRGLSPNRTSNFNTRQNGYDIAADALGYPESYYTPPSESIDRIEVTRGASSLQYGTQFGGVLNFELKGPNPDKKMDVILRQSIGSFGLFNTFNSIGGTSKNIGYYGFVNYKRGGGWRPNSQFESIVGHVQFHQKINDKLSYKIEFTKMSYTAQQAGGLTDKLFEEDASQSIRERNWFKIDWNVAAAIFTYRLNSKWRFEMRNFGLIGSRDALGILGYINRPDPEGMRDLMKDKYLNIGNETRMVHTYEFLGNPSNWLVGVRYYRGFTRRKQGNGSTGFDADFNFQDPDNPEYSNYKFPSQNVAAFTENVFQITPKWSVTPGVRFEHIITQSVGTYNVEFFDLAGNSQGAKTIEDQQSSSRSFVIGGIGTAYKLKTSEVYANISQNYRAINFNDMRVNNPNLQVDPNLQDEIGFSSDLGIRGNISKYFIYDVSGYYLQYAGRIGTVSKEDERTLRVIRYRTNVSDSRNIGLESYGEMDVLGILTKGKSKTNLNIFSNFTIQDAKYINSSEPAYQNKQVENVPSMILKTGVNLKWKKFKIGYQYSYNSEQFSDATNASFSPNAIVGTIPAYWVMDLSGSYEYKKWKFETGINNLTDNRYFTRRAAGYPGPGIIPADPINFYGAVQLHF